MNHLIELPEKLFIAVQMKASEQKKTPENLVIEWVAERLHEPESSYEALDREADAFEQLKPMLMEKYAGQYVAIYQGKLITYGDNQFVTTSSTRAIWAYYLLHRSGRRSPSPYCTHHLSVESSYMIRHYWK
jgi:hypothetical protein